MNQSTLSLRIWTVLAVAGMILALAAGLFAGRFWRDSVLHPGGRAAIEKIVHDYILEHPEILPQAMENLQKLTDDEIKKMEEMAKGKEKEVMSV